MQSDLPRENVATTGQATTGQATTTPYSANLPSIPPVPTSLRWGAIFGGAVACLGLAVMLNALGLALGLSWIDPQDPNSIRPSSVFSGIWLLVMSLVALFVGGYVAARGAGAISRGFGALHGLVMWGLSVTAGVWLLGNVASAVVKGGAHVGAAAASAVSEGMTASSQLSEMPRRLGLTADDLLEPVNQRLRSEGKPEIAAQQLERATRDVLRRAARERRLDREMLTESLTSNTGLSRADAEQVANDAQTRFDAARERLQRDLQETRTSALSAAEQSSKAFWAIFGALLLGMLAALGGALLAAQNVRKLPRRQSAAIGG
jgi:hypothetical protein